MTDYRWRRKAKELLYNFTTNQLLLAQAERDIIYGSTPQRDHCYRRGGIANPTLMKVQQLDAPELNRMRREVASVRALLHTLDSERRLDRQKKKMLEMVYFRGSHSLLGSGVMLEVSERTVKRWNTQVLEFIARDMGWLDE